MPEWRYEQGIGEDRAILVEAEAIVEAVVELPDTLRAASVVEGGLVSILAPGRRGIVALGAQEALLDPLPQRLTEGQIVRVEIVREAIQERGRAKLARCRLSEHPLRAGPDLLERIKASGYKVARSGAFGLDSFEQAGWSELLEQAGGGEIAFAGGALRMSLTPAMTLFDVDGDLLPPTLAVAGAAAAGRAIRRFGITGSIGLDLPTLASREHRQAAAAALDEVLPQPFERTAVNGFGFLQVVRKRERPSLPELLQNDPVGAAARALLRRAEREQGSGERVLQAAPAVIALLEAQTPWLEELARRAGVPVALRADPGLTVAAGHAHSRPA